MERSATPVAPARYQGQGPEQGQQPGWVLGVQVVVVAPGEGVDHPHQGEEGDGDRDHPERGAGSGVETQAHHQPDGDQDHPDVVDVELEPVVRGEEDRVIGGEQALHGAGDPPEPGDLDQDRPPGDEGGGGDEGRDVADVQGQAESHRPGVSHVRLPQPALPLDQLEGDLVGHQDHGEQPGGRCHPRPRPQAHEGDQHQDEDDRQADGEEVSGADGLVHRLESGPPAEAPGQREPVPCTVGLLSAQVGGCAPRHGHRSGEGPERDPRNGRPATGAPPQHPGRDRAGGRLRGQRRPADQRLADPRRRRGEPDLGAGAPGRGRRPRRRRHLDGSRRVHLDDGPVES